MTDTQKCAPCRQIFIVSDGTAITAETLAHSIMTQFPDLDYHQTRIPFVNTVEKALETAQRINQVEKEEGLRPIIFTTFVDPDIMRTFNEHVSGHIIDLFRKFVGPLETELGMKSAHSIGQSHRIRDDAKYNRRIAAIDYTLQHDDGQHIEQRHNDRDQDRDGAELIGAEQRRRHGDAHDDVVAAEHALDHHAAALRQLFGQQCVAEREAERQQHAAHGIGHQQRVKRAGQIGAIYIIIKQTWQKNTESDLVDGGDLLTAEPAECRSRAP